MARHSHWAQIKLKKGAEDAKRGKVFTKYAKLIEMCARSGGGDPETNPSLRIAIENARSFNLPKDNIQRAIQKGTGGLSGGAALQSASYEGFGPGGFAIIIDALTDNKNRTNQALRGILQEHGGSLASPGAVSFLFSTQGVITIKPQNKDSDELEMIDAGAIDIENEENELVVYTVPSELFEVKEKLKAKGFAVVSAELKKAPQSFVKISDPAAAKKALALMAELDEQDDVTAAAANFEIEEGLGIC